MRLFYTPRAQRDLQAIFTYIDRNNPAAATNVVDRIHACAEALETFPYMGHIGPISGTFDLTVPELPYVIVYRVELGDDDRIAALSVYHGAQDREQDTP